MSPYRMNARVVVHELGRRLPWMSAVGAVMLSVGTAVHVARLPAVKDYCLEHPSPASHELAEPNRNWMVPRTETIALAGLAPHGPAFAFVFENQRWTMFDTGHRIVLMGPSGAKGMLAVPEESTP